MELQLVNLAIVLLLNEGLTDEPYLMDIGKKMRDMKCSRFVIYADEVISDDGFDLHSFEKDVVPEGEMLFRLKETMNRLKDYRFDKVLVLTPAIGLSTFDEVVEVLSGNDLVLGEEEGRLVAVAFAPPIPSFFWEDVRQDDLILDMLLAAQRINWKYKVIKNG